MLPVVRQTLAARLPSRRGEGVLAAVSGGSDSTALALTLAETGARLEIAHVHHGIRGPGADADADSTSGEQSAGPKQRRGRRTTPEEGQGETEPRAESPASGSSLDVKTDDLAKP